MSARKGAVPYMVPFESKYKIVSDYKFHNKKLIQVLVLTALFGACFLIPVLWVTKMGTDESALVEGASEKRRDALFPLAVNVNREGKFLKVGHRAEFIPSADSDYLLVFWVNLKNLPAIDERLVLLSKYEGAPPRIQGFAVGLKRDATSIRPTLFWGDGSSDGRWYDFPEISMLNNQWNVFGLQVHAGRFVGMYVGRTAAGQSLPMKFLGGHEIAAKNPLSLGTADLVFGAPSGRDFRGKLGPLAIINPSTIPTDSLVTTLNEYSKTPLDFSELGSSSELKLLIIDGKSDSSSSRADVTAAF